MKTLISHPTGNQNVRAAAKGLVEADIAAAFHTSIAVFPGDVLHYLSRIPAFAEFKRRLFDQELKMLTKTWPWQEVGRLLALRTGSKGLTKHETGLFCIDAVYRRLDSKVASTLQLAIKSGMNAVYAYEDGALQTFREAKHLGLHCLYDLPIGYWRSAERLLEYEKKKWPEWASTLVGLQNSQKKLFRKDEELLLADRIFVASQFTARTLRDFPGKLAPIEVIPYGFPSVTSNRSYTTSRSPLKILFVGGLSQRKGIADLFAAVGALGRHVTLTVVGRKSTENCAALNAELAKYKWIPSLPHQDILKLMRSHDVLVFPSLFEGFGLVITEAMSQGTPVITTERTAGPDLIESENNGWIIKAGSWQVLQEAIESILYKPGVIEQVGIAALETARSRPWQVYGRELAAAVSKHTANSH